MTGYTEAIREWAARTDDAGEVENPDGIGEVGLGESEAGRRLAVRFTLRVEDESVVEARYQVFGCGFTIAAAAAVASWVRGATLDEVAKMRFSDIDAILGGLPPERAYCADFALRSLQAAVESVRNRGEVVRRAADQQEDDHTVVMNDALYRLLMLSPAPVGILSEDRHFFASVFASAEGVQAGGHPGIGLTAEEVDALLTHYFPAVDRDLIPHALLFGDGLGIAEDVYAVIEPHISAGEKGPAHWLARIISVRTEIPGHLWVSIGLRERPELGGTIKRILPGLFAANSQNMRWKRYLFREICHRNGGVLCKSPNCGVCSDYELCFPKGEEA